MHRNESALGSYLLPAPVGGGFEMEGYWVWCGSVMRGEDGNFHMFASRWSKSLPFHPGWGVESEIVRAVSATPEGPYRFAEVVLPARGAGWWDGRSTHNPSIQRCGDEYVLFYVGMTHPFPSVPRGSALHQESPEWLCARANKRIGIATAKSVFGPWRRRDRPILDVRPGCFDDYFTSNPAPCLNEDGSCLLVYKTRTYAPPPYGEDLPASHIASGMKLGAAFAPHYSGGYRRLTEQPLFSDGGVLEDPFIWRTSSGYAMIAKDWGGSYTGRVGDGVYAASGDGTHWTVERGADFGLDIAWNDGVTRRMGNIDRPFLLFDESGQATHFFFATNDGAEAGFATLSRSWNACVPLR